MRMSMIEMQFIKKVRTRRFLYHNEKISVHLTYWLFNDKGTSKCPCRNGRAYGFEWNEYAGCCYDSSCNILHGRETHFFMALLFRSERRKEQRWCLWYGTRCIFFITSRCSRSTSILSNYVAPDLKFQQLYAKSYWILKDCLLWETALLHLQIRKCRYHLTSTNFVPINFTSLRYL